MSNRTVIISLSDEKYFQLLLELIDSIKRFEESKEIADPEPFTPIIRIKK